MSFSESITDAQLDAVAREATSLFMSKQAEDATDAVVLAARPLGPRLTEEHVKRACEKTYREIFERMHKAASGDRNVVFDPPVAAVAAQRLTADKIASARAAHVRAHPAAPGSDKTASATELPRKFVPVDVFGEVTKAAQQEPAPTGVADLRFVVRDMRHMVAELEQKQASAAATVQITLLDLIKEARQCVADGVSARDIIFSGADGVSELCPDLPEQHVEKAAALLVRGLLETNTPVDEKVAQDVRVNHEHPLIALYAKLANAIFDHEVVSEGLSTLRPEFKRASDGLRALSTA